MDDLRFLRPTAEPGTAEGGGINLVSAVCSCCCCWIGVDVDVKLELLIPDVCTKSMGRLMGPSELGWLCNNFNKKNCIRKIYLEKQKVF